MRALITCGHLLRHLPKFEAIFAAAGAEISAPPLLSQQFSAEEMAKLIVGCDTVIAGDDFIDRKVLEIGLASKLRSVIKWGVGTDSIDKQAAAQLGLPIYNTPGVFGEEVADLAMSYLLMLARQLHRMNQSVVDGGWLKVEGRSLNGMSVGIVGLGSIGQAIARRCHGFGMTIRGYDTAQIDSATLTQLSVTQTNLPEVLADADVVFIACNLSAENHHLFGTATFSQMKRGAFLINISRGPLVDEDALADALSSGQIGAAGLDVFEVEPLPTDSRLRGFQNCVLGTHNGSNTAEAVDRVNRQTVAIALHVMGLKPDPAVKLNRVA